MVGSRRVNKLLVIKDKLVLMLPCLFHKQLVYSSTRSLVHSSTHPLNTCSSVTLSSLASNLFTRQLNMFTHLPAHLVNFFQALRGREVLFWLLKDALLACKRCPLRPLLTPFWSTIKHLLLYYFITIWLTVSYESTFYTCFYPLF